MRRSAPRTLSLLACLALLGACGPLGDLDDSDDGLGTRQTNVVNGQVYSGHPSAGKLTTGSSLCTATLIGKKTVVTAAHCVSPGYTHTFTVGGVAYKSASATQHPSYNSYQITNDIAVVMLQDAPSVQGATIATSAPSVGTEIIIVGYGKTSEYISDAGTKRMGKTTIAEVTSTRLRIPASSSLAGICNGDSGGPSYATLNGVEVQVGVHSTKSGACGSGGHDTRVDAFADWITQVSGGDVNKPGSGTNPPGGGTNPPGGTTPPPTDSQAPQVTITYPVAGAKVAASITVTTSIKDDKGVTKVALYVDNKVVASGAAQSFPVALTPGQHTLRVEASDAANNKGQASVTVTVEGATQPAPPNPGPAPAPGPDPAPQPAPAPTPNPGTFGATCQSAGDCSSGLCADDQTLGARYCTQSCGPSAACPTGATCFSSASGSVCGLDVAPPNNNGLQDGELLGSCSVSGRASPASGAWLALALALLLVLRRRRGPA